MNNEQKKQAITLLNQIMELELAGVVRYTHYSLMIYGYGRLPIVSWMKDCAQEGIDHAQRAGELVTLLGGHPSLGIGALLESSKHDIGDILKESLEHEESAIRVYYQVLDLGVAAKSVLLEEYARELIVAEEMHLDEVNKMLRRPGDIAAYHPDQ